MMTNYTMLREFWKDPIVIRMTPEEKYFFLYLLTNSNVIKDRNYQITKKQIAFDLDYTVETVQVLMNRCIKHHKLISYNAETRELTIEIR